jgi:hypothetical protein
MTWQVLRTVAEELDVATLVDQLTEAHPRFDEVWEGIKWILARTPDMNSGARRAKAARNYRVHVFVGDALADTPDVWVTYFFTDNEVVILGIMATARTDDPQ